MRLIQHIKASNLLSFGPDGLDLELHDLNVLIGPNGSGKSNFLEIFELLRSLPRSEEDSNNLERILNHGGGISEWNWKGNSHGDITLEIDVSTEPVWIQLTELLWKAIPTMSCIRHRFHVNAYSLIEQEFIENPSDKNDEQPVFSFYEKTKPRSFSIWDSEIQRVKDIETPYFTLSILSQRFSNIATSYIASCYERIRLYREWPFGRYSIIRTSQRADLRNDRLESDFSNLGMVLSRLRKTPAIKRALVTALQDLYEGLTDFEVVTEGGTVQIFFTEGDFSIPAARLSDGTLRYLCLLAILLDPTPPPLICIEEPELGLHPDLLPKIADLLVDASKRTQLIITTHSDVLIDALSERPETVLVCEKHEGQTHIKRLDRSEIGHWLEDYRLGQLWTRGEIGGTRW